MPQDDLNVINIDGVPEVIRWFDDLGSGNEDYNFLSNFYRGHAIVIPGLSWGRANAAMGLNEMDPRLIEFKTGEHIYAALKAWGTSAVSFRDIIRAEDPNDAKALGRECRIRPDWEEIKYDVMSMTLHSKFSLGRPEAQRLLDTKDALLVEGTFWGDETWGVDLDSAANVSDCAGRNWLGRLLMARRAELRAESYFGHTSESGIYNKVFAFDHR